MTVNADSCRHGWRGVRRFRDDQETLAFYAPTVEVLRVIEETMLPEHVSLWLADFARFG